MKRWEVEVFGWNLGRHEDTRWVSHHWTRAGAAVKQGLILAAINRRGGSYRTSLGRTRKKPKPQQAPPRTVTVS